MKSSATQKTLMIVSALVVLIGSSAWAQSRPPRKSSGSATLSQGESRITYDLSAAAGSTNGASYTEITLGLNWLISDWFNWRNSVFSRQGSTIETVQGLDSSARFSTSINSESGGLGLDAFAGPGVRLASKDNNAVFGEAGVIFKLGGLRIGGGVKALSYLKDRTDNTGATLPKTDTQYFIVLAGSGTL